MSASSSKLQTILTLAITLPALYVTFLIYQSGQLTIALAILALTGLFNFIYLNGKAYTYRYLFPGLLGFGLFIIFPLIYTFVIGFSKYEASNLLPHERVKADFLKQEYKPDDLPLYDYTVYAQDRKDYYRLHLVQRDDSSLSFWSETFELEPPRLGPRSSIRKTDTVIALNSAPGELTGQALELADLTRPRLYIPLAALDFETPDGTPLSMDGLRRFATQLPLWVENESELENTVTGETIRPDHDAGFYVDSEGNKVGFGFRTWAGFDNYQTIVSDERVKGPFVRIFIWTILFAGLSVLLTFALGMALAVLLEWEELKGRKVYRTLLILPYAVPAFLSILVFQGMFNQEAGAINEFLNALFGLKPEWTTNPLLAKAMVLIVNIWLGYPYMMLIATGVLQSVPKQIYEASAIDGSNTLHNFFKLTLPLILPPLLPLLIASFAFNFNNFNLVFLLTQGGPKMVNSTGVAGETDILVTYTFNLAFMDSGNNYGLACAIATILFFIVGTLAYINLKMTNRSAALR